MPRRLGKRQNSSSFGEDKKCLKTDTCSRNMAEKTLARNYDGCHENTWDTYSTCSQRLLNHYFLIVHLLQLPIPQHKFYQDQWDLATLMEWFNAHWTPRTHLASYSDYRTPQWIRTSLQQKQRSRVSSWILPVFLLFEANVCSKSSFSLYLCLNSLELGDVLGQV